MSTSAGAAPPSSGPRRSARALARGRRQMPDKAPSTPAFGDPPAGGPSSHPRRRRRGASPERRSVRAREMDDLQPVAAVLDGDELKQLVEAEEWMKQGKEVMEEEEPEEVDKDDADALKEAPFWFPDGWIINIRHGNGDSTYRCYTSPVSEYTFSTNMEALHYLFSEMDERVLESQACAEDNKLHRMHTWLPDGWVLEVRAGGKMMDKMYKFYVHLPTGMRFFSKEDVFRYVNEGEISRCNVKGLCDTSSEDNILAQVEFNPDGLPEGWVKEITFRKCSDGIRKDPYYTDPVSHHVFRTLRSVMSYLETGEISRHAYIPKRSVMDMYSFDKSTDLPHRLLKRLKVQGKTKRNSLKAYAVDKKLPDDHTSNHCLPYDLDPQSEPEGRKFMTIKDIGKETVISDNVKRPRGRPRKIMKQTSESTQTLKATRKEAVTSETINRQTAEGGTSAGLKPRSEPKGKMFKTVQATCKEPISSHTIKRRRGRPQKVMKQTNETTSACIKSLHKETAHIVVKNELDIGDGEQMSKENTLECQEMEKHVTVIQEVDNKSDLARSLSTWRDKLRLVTNSDLHEQENGNSTEASEKSTSSSVHKFYMRRNSNQTSGFKKGQSK